MFLTYQQVTVKVASHLLAQGQRAAHGGDGSCKYRAPNETDPFGDELKCSVGFLIPDGRYNTRFEGKGIGALLERMTSLDNGARSVGYDFAAALAEGGIDVNDPNMVALLKTLQGIHDGASNATFVQDVYNSLNKQFGKASSNQWSVELYLEITGAALIDTTPEF